MFKVSFILESNELLNKGFSLELPIKEISDEVKKSVETDLKKPASFDNSSLKPLSRAWIKRKGHSRIFDGLRKGKQKLFNSVISKRISKNEYWVTFSNDKNEMIMDKLSKDGRRGFGVTDATLDRIVQYVINKEKI